MRINFSHTIFRKNLSHPMNFPIEWSNYLAQLIFISFKGISCIWIHTRKALNLYLSRDKLPSNRSQENDLLIKMPRAPRSHPNHINSIGKFKIIKYSPPLPWSLMPRLLVILFSLLQTQFSLQNTWAKILPHHQLSFSAILIYASQSIPINF